MARKGIWALAVGLVVLLMAAFGLGRMTARPSVAIPATSGTQRTSTVAPTPADPAITVYAHNLLLRKGDHFRIYVRWIRGRMERTQAAVNPSFDASDSFVLQIDKGIISVQLKDLNDFLNAGQGTGSPLKNISLQAGNDGQIELHGTLHKVVPLPVKVTGVMSPLPDGRVQFHVVGINALKMPVKGLLGMFHVSLSDLVASPQIPGVEIVGNDVRFDTEKLLPPPHIHGQITAVAVSPTELKILYGDASDPEEQLAQWHNFLRLRGGTLNFGKLTMHDVDLTMIDASQSPWFDLDLVNYQAQLVNGYTRVTAQQGLEIYMPDLADLQAKKASQAITLPWLQNRNSALPSDVPIKDGKPTRP